MVSRSDPGSFQRTTTCIWMPDVRLLHYFEPTQWRSVSGLDDGKRKTKRGWSPGDSLKLVRVLSVRVNYSQQCRNDINGRWEYSKSIIGHFYACVREMTGHGPPAPRKHVNNRCDLFRDAGKTMRSGAMNTERITIPRSKLRKYCHGQLCQVSRMFIRGFSCTIA